MKYVLMIPTFMHFTSLVVQAAGPPAVPGENVERSSQPNLVVFLADDQGWGDLSCHGNKNLATPNIDSLAKDGTKLDNFYVCGMFMV